MSLDKEMLRELVIRDLDEVTDGYNVGFEVVEINTDNEEEPYALVKIPIVVVPEDDYIGICYY
jgi:hypothetical protein